MSKSRISRKASRFTESVIREMTRLAHRHSAVNLAQGFPNFPTPQPIKDAACRAIQEDINQYAITWGAAGLRQAIAEKYRRFYDWKVDPERHVTVACGATECMMAVILALVDPGEKVLVIEPFYENYGPDAIIADAQPIYVSLDPQRRWALDLDRLEATIRRESQQGDGIRALVLNSPHNPTGKIFSHEELGRISELACRYDFYVVTDEIYEHILFDEARHEPIALFPGMMDRTVTVSGLSKSYSVTGWRIGYIVAPADLSDAIRKMHDFLTVGAAAPLQEAGIAAVSMPGDYYRDLAQGYERRRDFFLPHLKALGFRFEKPLGAYYVLCDFSQLDSVDDVAFVKRMISEIGVAGVPGSSFYQDPERGRTTVRFAFCKTRDMLEEAVTRLQRFAS